MFDMFRNTKKLPDRGLGKENRAWERREGRTFQRRMTRSYITEFKIASPERKACCF